MKGTDEMAVRSDLRTNGRDDGVVKGRGRMTSVKKAEGFFLGM